ncbi:MAG: hypothetical protein V3T23_05755 [Nitrososphaerales archaeon]
MGMDVSTADVRRLLQDKKFMDQVIAKVMDDPETLEDLAEDVAEEIADQLEDDPTIKQKILTTALGTPGFRNKVSTQLAQEIGD